MVVDIRRVLKRHFLKALIPQNLTHDVQFIAVDFTAQIVKSYSFFQMILSC